MHMKIFQKAKNKPQAATQICTQTSPSSSSVFADIESDSITQLDLKNYKTIRNSIPIVDAAISKIIRLIGGFKIDTSNPIISKQVNNFLDNVIIIGNGNGINNFITCYLDSLLTYGNAIGEIVLNSNNSDILALFNANVTQIQVKRSSNSIATEFWLNANSLSPQKIKCPQLLLFSALNPSAGEVNGNSLIKGLQLVGNILMKIYTAIGSNFDRIGNVRFAVNYKPDPSVEIDSVQEIAQNIATQWEKTMQTPSDGNIRDFVAIGDMEIKVIGADNSAIDTSAPVRQMLEQIVAKLSIPPFLLGLNWSTTERMSKQQCEILISEIQSYRRILSPIISKIVKLWLRLHDLESDFSIVWEKINLQDEVSQARAQLMFTQAKRLESEQAI